MADDGRLSAEQLAEIRRMVPTEVPVRDLSLVNVAMRELLAHIDAQQAEIDRLQREYADRLTALVRQLVDALERACPKQQPHWPSLGARIADGHAKDMQAWGALAVAREQGFVPTTEH